MRISIIVPVFNAEKYLDETIVSIVSQTYKDIEVILINDGSLDSSEAICAKWSEQDSRIRLYSQKNAGVSATRNRGIQIAKGEYIIFQDADDCLASDLIERIVSGMNKKDENNLIMWKYSQNRDELYAKKGECSRDVLSTDEVLGLAFSNYRKHSQYSFSSPWAKMFKAKIIKDNKILFPTDLRVGEDKIFFLRCLPFVSECVLFDYVGYYYRPLQESAVNKFDSNMLGEFEKIISYQKRMAEDNDWNKSINYASQIFDMFRMLMENSYKGVAIGKITKSQIFYDAKIWYNQNKICFENPEASMKSLGKNNTVFWCLYKLLPFELFLKVILYLRTRKFRI